jgi:hypothetical protein
MNKHHLKSVRYLAGTSLGQIRNNVDPLGSSKRSDDFADLQDEFLVEVSLVAILKVSEMPSEAK